MRLQFLTEDRGVVVAKALDSTELTIRRIPGYCWSLDGFLEIWGDGQFLSLPYRGAALFATRVMPSRYVRWPFEWAWADAKGHTGPPGVIYTSSQIAVLARAGSLVELAELDVRLGNRPRAPELIARDVVKSVQPGIVIPTGETYTGNFEVIINEPVVLTRLAVGSLDSVGNNQFPMREIEQSLRAI